MRTFICRHSQDICVVKCGPDLIGNERRAVPLLSYLKLCSTSMGKYAFKQETDWETYYVPAISPGLAIASRLLTEQDGKL